MLIQKIDNFVVKSLGLGLIDLDLNSKFEDSRNKFWSEKMRIKKKIEIENDK